MDRRRATSVPSALALALALTGACARAPEHPNVLLISVDMLRPDHLGCYGYARATSPAFDRIAAEGVLFENHISSTSWTLPAHASLFTSLPDSIHGCRDHDKALAEDQVTLAERFRSAGYATAGFFSGPFLHPAFGLGQGFDVYEDCTSYAQSQHSRSELAVDREVMRASHRDVTNPTVFAAFERWLGRRDEKRPFFLFLHMWDVHFDFIPPAPFDRRFDPAYAGTVTGENFFFDPKINADMPARDREHLVALYDGEIAWTDSFLARIRAELERVGAWEDTVVALTSDHGTELFDHGGKGHRKTLFDEVIRIPLVLRCPARLPSGARIGAQTRMVDVGPTLLALAGLEEPRGVVGESLLPLVQNPSAARGRRAVSELATMGRDLRAVRTREWKFFDDIGHDACWYFDLAHDPRELQPLGDRANELGRRAETGYLAEVAALNGFLEQHPSGADAAEIPPGVAEQLERFGYTGGEEPAPPK